MVEESRTCGDGDLQLVKDSNHRHRLRQRHGSGSSSILYRSFPADNDLYSLVQHSNYPPHGWQIPHYTHGGVSYSDEQASISNPADTDSDLKPTKNCSHRRHSLMMRSMFTSPTNIDNGANAYYPECIDNQWVEDSSRLDQEVLESDLKPSLNCSHRQYRPRYYDQLQDGRSNILTVECKNVLSAYEFHRHLEPSCTHPSTCDYPVNNTCFDETASDLTSTLDSSHRPHSQMFVPDIETHINSTSDIANSSKSTQDSSFDDTASVESDLRPTLDCSHRRRSRLREYLNRSWDSSRMSTNAVQVDLIQYGNVSHRQRLSLGYQSIAAERSYGSAAQQGDEVTMTTISHTDLSKSMDCDPSNRCNTARVSDCDLSRSFDSCHRQRHRISSQTLNSSSDSTESNLKTITDCKHKRNRPRRNRKISKEFTCSRQTESVNNIGEVSSVVGEKSSETDLGLRRKIRNKKKLKDSELHDTVTSSSGGCLNPDKGIIDTVNQNKDSDQSDNKPNQHTASIRRRPVTGPTANRFCVLSGKSPKLNRGIKLGDETTNENNTVDKHSSDNDKRPTRKRFRSGSDSNLVISHKRKTLTENLKNTSNIIESDVNEQFTATILSHHPSVTVNSDPQSSNILSEKVDTIKKVRIGIVKSSSKTPRKKSSVKQGNKSISCKEKTSSKEKPSKRRSWPRVDRKQDMIQKLHKTLAKFDLNEGKFGANKDNNKMARLELSDLETMMPLSAIDCITERRVKYNASVKQHGVLHRKQDTHAIWEGVMSKFVS